MFGAIWQVGFLAERVFGFSGAAAPGPSREDNLAKAEALGSALLVFLLVPWTLCLLLYTGPLQRACWGTVSR